MTTDVRLVSILRRHGARGTFDGGVKHAVRDAGHLYARTTRVATAGVETFDAMAAAPSCHFIAPDFWQQFDRARSTGFFRFWGQSDELVDEAMWTAFDVSLARL